MLSCLGPAVSSTPSKKEVLSSVSLKPRDAPYRLQTPCSLSRAHNSVPLAPRGAGAGVCTVSRGSCCCLWRARARLRRMVLLWGGAQALEGAVAVAACSRLAATIADSYISRTRRRRKPLEFMPRLRLLLPLRSSGPAPPPSNGPWHGQAGPYCAGVGHLAPVLERCGLGGGAEVPAGPGRGLARGDPPDH